MRLFLIALLSLVLGAVSALAQQADRPNTILVLDGSGSMWGQIDGENKIVIARNVIADLLAEMPDDASLGLTVYGHRERGSCSDIETIVAPAPGTQDAILDAVNGINPRGRTPMSDAVVAAARSLRHTEEVATVILVSDGIENCNPDPCAIAAELEATGVGFTAHVVGFDVASEPEARAQMQCIAENTGGLFLTADNASELAEALDQVVMAPAPVDVTVLARVMPGNTVPVLPVDIAIESVTGDTLVGPQDGDSLSAALLPGDYFVRAFREEPGGLVPYTQEFVVMPNMPLQVVVEMPPVELPQAVTFRATEDPGGSAPQSPLEWVMTEAGGGAIVGPMEAANGGLDLMPGRYEISARRLLDDTVISESFTVSDASVDLVLNFPEMPLEVAFTARIGAADGPLVRDPVIWTLSPEIGELPETINPGMVELLSGAYSINAYWTAQEIEETVAFDIFAAPREIIVVFPEPQEEATLIAPPTAVAGSMIEVTWTGPDHPDDYIGIGLESATGPGLWANYVYTREGSPAALQVPMTEGRHVISYFLGDGRDVIGTTSIDVTLPEVTLSAPAVATAGTEITVAWTGPNYDGDYIGIGRVGASGPGLWENYVYTREGSPAPLLVPGTEGDYVITYFAGQDRTPMAEIPITVGATVASVTAPATAAAGSMIEISFTGPAHEDDYIGIGVMGASGPGLWENYVYAREGSPTMLQVPPRAGSYVITYFLGQDRMPLAETMITVTDVDASIIAPTSAVAGSTIQVSWTGPGYEDDYIGIGVMGASGPGLWENYVYTRDGSPAALLVPPRAGSYVITYFVGQDREAIAETSITVTPATATLNAPSEAAAGGTVQVTWTGPGHDADFIGIGPVGATGPGQWASYVYTREGSPATLSLPEEPGAYVIRYFLDQDYTEIGSTAITLK